jgi:hypothetical protein
LQVLRGIGQQYPNLFSGGGEEGIEGSGGTFYTKYGWIALINTMANNDRSKWDYFFEMNIIEFLNAVCFSKDKAEHEQKEMERIRRQHGSF